mmetsp:Transcript_28010/g.75665  ORF Transcript_28010/g.75665 Transcript_28010/m.75665 type:complete len:88 (-) Transcript_28010:774-1037(-)
MPPVCCNMQSGGPHTTHRNDQDPAVCVYVCSMTSQPSHATPFLRPDRQDNACSMQLTASRTAAPTPDSSPAGHIVLSQSKRPYGVSD